MVACSCRLTHSQVFFIALFLSIFATVILEMRWSWLGIDEWWRNEQFWVIGGVSAHLFSVVQGLLKVLAAIDTNFTVKSKASDEDGDFSELYLFKWIALFIPPTTCYNIVGVVVGISHAISSGYASWGPLFGKLFFAFWVIVHLYPFLKGLMRRQNRTPTIIVVWPVIPASIFSLLWVRIDPFTTQIKGPDWVVVHLYPFLKGLMGRQNRTPTIIVVWPVIPASIFSLLWVRIDPFTTQIKGPDLQQCDINC